MAADARKLAHRGVRKAKRQLGKQLRSRGWAPVAEAARKSGGGGVHGVVETFTKDAISGWVELPAGGKPVRITLHLEDLQVAGTWANDPIGRTGNAEIRGFRFVIKDIWNYAAVGERLTVRADGVPLPIAGVGAHVKATAAGRGTIGTLKRKLNSGHVFSRKGRLQLSKSLDEAWQTEVLDFYGKLRTTVKDALGLDLFVMYGSLLGAVREGGFIGHDDDFDVAAIVDASTGPEAIEQLKKLAFALIDAGYDVEGRRTAVHVHHRDNPKLRIDIFHLYFDAAGVLQFAFGVAGNKDVTKESWQGLAEQTFGPSSVLVPVNGEAMCETVYGDGWRVPNPGFNWDTDRSKRARDAIVPLDDVEEIYWANFYAKVEYTSGSTFQEWVNGREGMTEHVVDIGCGDGRDSYAFGQAGRHVTGLDRSHIGVRHADKKAHDMGMYPRVQFQACDVGEADPLRGVLAGATERAGAAPITFYARFFLHSIPEDVQETLMTTVASVARSGDKFAAEFRTTADAELAKVHTKHYRRFQDGWAFGTALRERYGFDVEFEVEDTGFSPYKDEDPVLYRVVATKR
ncbi:MAG: methyltransferase domain-containing protein [Sporichthyaceae bacterium]